MPKTRSSPSPLEVEIRGLSDDGLGIALVEGRQWLIPDVLPGERVSVLPVRGRSRVKATPQTVLEAARDRVEPQCKYFGVCGGCALQHMAPHSQWQLKQQVLERKFEAAGVSPDRWLAPLAGPLWAYRRRARLGVKHVVRKGRVLVGFRERFKPYIAVMDRCEILAEPVGDLLRPLGVLIEGLSLHNRIPQIEVAVGDNAVALVFRILGELDADDVTALQAFSERYDVRVYLQPGGLDSIYGLRRYAEPLIYHLPDFDVSLAFEPTDFLQVNGALNRKMVGLAADLLAPDASHTILDLFCGMGNFSLALARRARHIVGVEGDATLVDRARTNAVRNRLANAEFHQADLFQPVKDAGWMGGRYESVLLDPPRAGAENLMPHLGALGARRILYVSCHPETLARDAAMLVTGQGYRLTAAGIMDMFPHTAHVESMAVFDRER